MRAGRHDPGGLGLVQGLDVLLREHLEHELVAEPPCGIPRTCLGLTEDGEGDARDVQQFREGPRRLLRPVLQRSGAADPEQVVDPRQVLDGVAEHRHVEVQALGPVQPRAGVHPPRVALVLQVLQHRAGLARERGLDQHLEAAHVDDVVDVLDVDGALLHARPARRARPQHVGVDHAELLGGADQRPVHLGLPGRREAAETGFGYAAVTVLAASRRTRCRTVGCSVAGCRAVGREQGRRLREQMVAQVHDHQLGRQRLAGVPGRALVLAAATLRAGREVEHALSR